MGVSYACSLASTLYNDAEQRPSMVKQGLTRAGIEKVRSMHLRSYARITPRLVSSQSTLQVLGTKEIERLAGWTTRAGLTTEIAGVKEVAAPYMEMNTKELLLEGAKLVKMGGVEVRPNPDPDPNPDPGPKPQPQPGPGPEPEPGREAGEREHPAAVVRTRG